jgi:hypothetical protein
MLTQWLSWTSRALKLIQSPLLSTGRRLWAITEQAGLRPLGGIRIGPTWGPVDEGGLGLLVETLRNLVPLIEETGVATAGEIGIETYEQRLRDEWEKTRAVIALGPMVGAWATTGPQ